LSNTPSVAPAQPKIEASATMIKMMPVISADSTSIS
jgi:hypothetical protein